MDWTRTTKDIVAELQAPAWVRSASAMNFETSDVELNYKEAGMESVKPITLKWSAQLDVRDWGIDGVMVTVPDQDITVEYEVFDDSTDDYKQESQTVHISNVKVSIEPGEEGWKQLAPKSLDWYKEQWQAEF
jgi:hypothetical protein